MSDKQVYEYTLYGKGLNYHFQAVVRGDSHIWTDEKFSISLKNDTVAEFFLINGFCGYTRKKIKG